MNPISNLPPIVDSAGYLVDHKQNALGSAAAPVDGSVASSGSFAQSLVNAVGSLSGLQANADAVTAGLATNQGTDVHQAMIAMEQASLGMSLAVQVRDKAVEAYQSLANMQM
jgi:flagellar hook-basal body complex protein FliE